MDPYNRVNQLSALRIQLLGEFNVWVGERLVPPEQWKLRKAQSLLKLLALAPQHRMHKEALMEQLWPESDPELAANSLHRALYLLRRALAPPGAPGREDLSFQGECLCLRPEQPLWVDVDAFEAAAVRVQVSQEVTDYQAALALYTGQLLPEDRFEEWASPRREALRQEHLRLLLELAGLHETRGETAPAIEALKRLLSTDPAHEEAAVRLMRLYALSGQRQRAIRQYQALQETLRCELEVDPEPQTVSLYQEIMTGRFPPRDTKVETHPVSSSKPQAEREVDQPRHNLPVQLTSFVGREQELAEICLLLSPSPGGREGQPSASRLVTLIGAGGSGKTRLALECAFELVDVFPAGAWLVELAGLSDPELVPQAVASTLGVREIPGKPLLESLAAYLRSRSILLLDNCEHLVEACARLVEGLLRVCPSLGILATSREALGLPGERLFQLSPLSFPDTRRHLALEELAGYESVRLFIERAQMARSDFALSEHNAPFIAQVCTRLDGLPLAIELAAARVNLLSVEQIAARLDDRFRLLARGSRTAPSRQQTLQATLDWSYQLLSEPEQVLFRRLSVFAGGFDLEAAEAVGANPSDGSSPKGSHVGEKLEPASILDLLSRLVDKSMVSVERAEGTRRYRLLETVRAYALDHLEASGEAQSVHRRHAEYFLAFAEKAEPELKSARQLVWMEHLAREHDNLRAALAWCLACKEAEAGQRLAGALWYFWCTRSYFSEGLRWYDAALEMDGGTPASRLRAIAGEVFLLRRFYKNFEQASALCQEGLDLARGLGDQYFIVFLLIQLVSIQDFGSAQGFLKYPDPRIEGWIAEIISVAREIGDPWLKAYSTFFKLGDSSSDTFKQQLLIAEEILALARETGDRGMVAYSLMRMGSITFLPGEYSRACACLEESVALFKEMGDLLSAALAYFTLGDIAFRQGDYGSAYRYQEKRVELEKEVDHKDGIVHSLNAQGMIAHFIGEDAKAEACFEEGLALSRELDYAWGGATQLNSLGFLKLHQGEVEKAQGHFLESLKLYLGRDDPYLLAGNLYGLSQIALLQGQPERATRWLGAVGPTFDYPHHWTNPDFGVWINADKYARDLAEVKTRLGETAFSIVWEAGRALGLEGAIQEALAL